MTPRPRRLLLLLPLTDFPSTASSSSSSSRTPSLRLPVVVPRPPSPSPPPEAPSSTTDAKFVHLLLLLLLLLLSSVHLGDTDSPVYRGEFCHTDTFRANCSYDEVIIMTTATYGRMRLGRCVEIALGHVGCSADVLAMADRRCSGKRTCSIRIPDAEFESTRPCLKELKTYLEASFQCVPVQTLTSEVCRTRSEFSVVGDFGYIASIVTSDTASCDGSRQPWTIRTTAGRKINLTLYDFSLDRRQDGSSPRDGEGRRQEVVSKAGTQVFSSSSNAAPAAAAAGNRCRQYGVLEDSATGRTLVICGGHERVASIYTSQGDTVRIWITAGIGPRDLQRFVIHYSVVGCADLVFRDQDVYWFSRSGYDLATVGCKHSNVAWHVRCADGAWNGHRHHNCSPLTSSSSSSSSIVQSFEAQERNSIVSSLDFPQSDSRPTSPPSVSTPFPSPHRLYFPQLSSTQFIATVVALSTGVVVVVVSVSFLAILKGRRRRKDSCRRKRRNKKTDITKDIGEKPFGSREFITDIPTLSSSIAASKEKTCPASNTWDSRYEHLDSFD